jgi:hypothetical protein
MTAYQECMTTAMKGFPKGINKEERRVLFCVEAKVCSGKITDRKAAEKYCRETPPETRPITAKKKRGQNCLTQVDQVIDCLLAQGFNDNPEAVLRQYLPQCLCGKQKTQAKWDAMSQEQKDALQMIELLKKDYGGLFGELTK